MNIAEEAFSRLFPDSELRYETAISYSGRFRSYNATVRRIGNSLFFSLSRSWEGVSDEIVIGLIQHLLVRILRREKSSSGKITSMNMQLYDDFIKGVSEVAAVDNSSADERLESSFSRVNEKYFLTLMDKPQLRWGADSFRKLAGYDYGTNTITVSSLFRAAPERLLDYLMHHEMLHKKLKFSSSNGRARHHSPEFRRLEEKFEGRQPMEQELSAFIRSSRRKPGRQRQQTSILRLWR